MNYYCQDCGASATVKDGRVHRTCAHGDSVVIAPCTATLYGEGGAAVLSLQQRVARALRQLLVSFKP